MQIVQESKRVKFQHKALVIVGLVEKMQVIAAHILHTFSFIVGSLHLICVCVGVCMCEFNQKLESGLSFELQRGGT